MEPLPITFCHVSTRSIKQEQELNVEDIPPANERADKTLNDEMNASENMYEKMQDKTDIELNPNLEACSEGNLQNIG